MTENIGTPAPSGSDLEERVPTTPWRGRSDPTGVSLVTPPKKFPLLLYVSLILLSIVSVISIYLFLQIRQLTLEKLTPSPTPTPSPSADPIADWQTYTNENSKFSFAYPKEWSRDTGTMTDSGDLLVINSASDSLLRIYQHKDQSKTIIDFLTKQDNASSTGWEGTPATEIVNTKKTIIAGLNSVQRVENMLAAGFVRVATYFKNENSFYQISLDPKNGGDLNPKDIETYNQILSTFKFIDQTSPSPSSKPIKVKILDTSSWIDYSCDQISYKIPSLYNQKCTISPDETSDVLITKDGEYGRIGNIHVRNFDGASRRQYWISSLGASSEEVSKYMRFQETLFGSVLGLDAFASGGWWQGGDSSPILISKGKKIVIIHGGRNFNDETNQITRWDITDSIASTIKFIK